MGALSSEIRMKNHNDILSCCDGIPDCLLLLKKNKTDLDPLIHLLFMLFFGVCYGSTILHSQVHKK